jgi:flagellar hook assembly protein FlgD
MKRILTFLMLFSMFAISVFANSNSQAMNIQIVPNPFTKSVAISSTSIHSGMNAVVTITDDKNNLIKTVFDGNIKTKFLQTSWDGTDFDNNKVKSGKYFVNITTNSRYLALKKVVILK